MKFQFLSITSYQIQLKK